MNLPANDHRRATPLQTVLRDLIRREGPLPVSRYMTLCLSHPEHGYYTTQRAVGAQGDFVTAPEISQIFGELVGLWVAVVWQTMGAPRSLRLVELGPGRGTLVRDALRAMAQVPGMAEALSIALVEINPTLRDLQRAALADMAPRLSWHGALDDVPDDGAAIVIGNEFLDTLANEQYVQTDDGPRLRTVALDAQGDLCFATRAVSAIPVEVLRLLVNAPAGTVAEIPMSESGICHWLARRPDRPVAALLVDYGHETSAAGETLQAVRCHQFEHVLTSPGEADLSVQVDFSRLAAEAARYGLVADGPLPQAEFLGQLGILERATRLMNANPDRAGEIEAGVLRLMAPNGMGTRFKAIGLRAADHPPLPGLVRPADP